MKRNETAGGASDHFEINQYALDEEWIRQTRLVYRYGQNLAEAKRDLDVLKAEMDLVDSEMDAEVRRRPSDFGIDKVTERSIQSAIVMSDGYKKIQKEVIDAKHEVDVLQAAVNALEHKKRALESLVQLHGMQYFAEPRASTEGVAEMAKSAVRKLGSRRRKNE